jgi:hypothetical protein
LYPCQLARERGPLFPLSIYLTPLICETDASYYALFAATAIAAIFFLIGWHTFCANLLLYWLVFSLQQRNSLLLNGGMYVHDAYSHH